MSMSDSSSVQIQQRQQQQHPQHPQHPHQPRQETSNAVYSQQDTDPPVVTTTEQSTTLPPKSQVRSSRLYEDFIVGGIASSLSRCVIAPLDVVKIRFQVQSGQGNARKYRGVVQAMRTIVQEEGIRALWKGNVPALLMMTTWGSISMLVTQQTKATWHKWHPSFAETNEALEPGGMKSQRKVKKLTNQDPTPMLSFFASGLGSVVATLATYPLDLMRTRFAVQPGQTGYRSLLGGMQQVYQANGIRGLYVGLGPTLVGIAPYMGLNFALYDASRATIRRLCHDYIPESKITYRKWVAHLEATIAGGLAGTVSKLITMPFDVVKKQMQTASSAYHFEKQLGPSSASSATLTPLPSAWTVVQNIVRTNGVQGLFRGCWPALIKAGPGSAVIYGTYEGILRLLLHCQPK